MFIGKLHQTGKRLAGEALLGRAPLRTRTGMYLPQLLRGPVSLSRNPQLPQDCRHKFHVESPLRLKNLWHFGQRTQLLRKTATVQSVNHPAMRVYLSVALRQSPSTPTRPNTGIVNSQTVHINRRRFLIARRPSRSLLSRPVVGDWVTRVS